MTDTYNSQIFNIDINVKLYASQNVKELMKLKNNLWISIWQLSSNQEAHYWIIC